MERRVTERTATALPISVVTPQGRWTGTCINLSSTGALLQLDSAWAGEEEIQFRFVSEQADPTHLTPAKVVRAFSPQNVGSFLAVRFDHLVN